MPALAPATAGTPPAPDEDIQTAGWSGEVTDPGVQDGNRMQFTGDGLDTGVRVMSMGTSGTVRGTGS